VVCDHSILPTRCSFAGMRHPLLPLLALAAALLVAAPATAASSRPSAPKLATAVATGIDGLLSTARANLVGLADLPVVSSGDAAACSAEMAARNTDPRYTTLGFATPDGNLDCLATPSATRVNIADRVYFLRATGTREYGVGIFQIGRATALGSIGLGYPVTDQASGTLLGVVISPLDLGFLATQVSQLRPAAAADVLVVDNNGTVLARTGTKATAAGTNLGADPLVRAMTASLNGTGSYTPSGTQRRVYAWATVPLSQGAVRVAVGLKRSVAAPTRGPGPGPKP
jgi:hypothetical protein